MDEFFGMGFPANIPYNKTIGVDFGELTGLSESFDTLVVETSVDSRFIRPAALISRAPN